MKYKLNSAMKSSVEHKISQLLYIEENEQIFKLFGQKCQSLATAIVQLYVTQGPDHSQWIKKDTGVLCFVKDHMKRNYFFRLYCMNRKMMVWEQELYVNLDYKSTYGFFHMFEANDYIAGLNFASDEEAITMRSIVLEKLEMKKHRREERRQRNAQAQTNNFQTNQDPYKPRLQPSLSINSDSTAGFQHNKNKKRRHLTKADISLPSDFKHISHVGWDPNKGFDINGDDPQLKQFFYKAGVSDYQLRDKDTREFIYDFIKTHGGLDAIKSEVDTTPKKVSSPYLPARSATEATPLNPPPVPARSAINRTAPPPPPPNKTRPPPQERGQPPQARGQPPPRPDFQKIAPPAPVPSPISNAPIPPPLPPLDDFMPPPLPVSLPPPSTNNVPEISMADPRSNLLESIRMGINLKPVERQQQPVIENSRNDLLSEIRQGIELKPVQNIPKQAPLPTTPSDGLAAALSQALKSRALAIHSDSGSDAENSSDDEDDWDNM